MSGVPRKGKDPYVEFLAGLSRAFAPGVRDEGVLGRDEGLSGVRRLLPGSTGARLPGVTAEVPAPLPPEAPRRYGLVEAVDGEPQVLRLFTTPEALARRVSEVDGLDVYVVAFVGDVVRVSEGPVRHLTFPGGRVMRVPYLPEEAPAFLDFPPDLSPQEDGFLGPPEFFLGSPAEPRRAEGGDDDGEEGGD